jgi:ribonuclease J
LARVHKLTDSIPAAGARGLTIYPPDDPRKTLRLVRPSMLQILTNDDKIRGGVYLYSLWQGYRKQDSQQELEAFLAARGFEIAPAHTSGHADTRTLKKVIKCLQPQRVIPIHTFAPDGFEALSDKVVIAKDGEIITI